MNLVKSILFFNQINKIKVFEVEIVWKNLLQVELSTAIEPIERRFEICNK